MMDWAALAKCKMLAIPHSTVSDFLGLAERMPLLVKCGPFPFAVIAHQMYYTRVPDRYIPLTFADTDSPETTVTQILEREFGYGDGLVEPILIHYGSLFGSPGGPPPPRLIVIRPEERVRYGCYSVTNQTEYGYSSRSLEGKRARWKAPSTIPRQQDENWSPPPSEHWRTG